MDAHLSATMENTPEPEGNDIRRAAAGYLVCSGRVIVRAGSHLGVVALAVEEDVALGPVDVPPSRYAGCSGESRWRGGRGRGGVASDAQAGRSPDTPTGRGRRRAALNGGLKSLPPRWPCLVLWKATYGIGARPRNSPNRIHRTASIGRGAGLVAACHRRWQPSALMPDVRSLFRSGTRAACLPAGDCGSPQQTRDLTRSRVPGIGA